MLLSQMRDAVRTQLELDEDDLPNALVDMYLREGFQRTIQREQRWPFLQQDWAVSSTTNGEHAFPVDLAGLNEVVLDDVPLAHISHDLAKQAFSSTGGSVRYFSLWKQTIHVWPTPADSTTIEIRGWRLPAEFALPGASAASEPDMDYRLHLTLVHYACSRVYAQQEDEILERTYLESWDRGVEMARADIMRPIYADQLIINGGLGLQVATGFRRTSLEV